MVLRCRRAISLTAITAALLGGLLSAGGQPPAPYLPPVSPTAPALPVAGPVPGLSSLEGAPPTGPLVAEVRVVGHRTVRLEKVQSFLRTRKDREFDPQQVKGDVSRLVTSGLFQDVRTYTEQTPAGMVVTFEVFERPTIEYIRFIGNRGVTDRALMKQCGLQKGEALNTYAVEEARRRVEEFYRSKGFPKAQVVILEGRRVQDRGVVLDVSEGVKEKIGGVDFVGNTIASDGRLKTQIQSKPGILWSMFSGRVDRTKLEEDEERLTAYYRSLGYFRARIGREVTYDESGKWAKINFVVDEGPRYIVRSVSVNGNDLFASGELINHLELKSGEFFNQGKMNRDVSALRDAYGGEGYIFADIKADPRFIEEPGHLDLVYNIEEGQQFRVGKINVNIAGENPHTRDSVILNRLSLRPGDIIDIREVRASERRLKAAQLFEDESSGGTPPKITIEPPSLETAAGLANQPRSSSTYRGQSPDGGAAMAPVGLMDLNVFATPQAVDQLQSEIP